MGALEVAVVGGSIGGLTVACLLRDRGHDVTVYERSNAELEARGAGIGLLDMTARYLVDRVGVPVNEIAIETSAIRHLSRNGDVAHDAPHRYLFSSWNTVFRQLARHWGTDRYRLGHEVAHVVDQGVVCGPEARRARIRFADGRSLEADLVVAADGVGSTVRAQLQPHTTMQYAGYVAWRGTVRAADLSPSSVEALGDAITYYVHANGHILVYPIPSLEGSVAPADRLLNFVWYRNYLEGGELDDVLTDRAGHRRELSVPPGAMRSQHVDELRAVAAARLPSLVAEIVLATVEPFVQVIYDIEVDRMVFGRVCLLGDAACAVRPHAAAGSAKAAADSWALDEALGEIASETGRPMDLRLAEWERSQVALGRDLLERTRRIGYRSQTDHSWTAGDPELVFGLFEPGN